MTARRASPPAPDRPARYVVIGAGAVGATIGGRLHAAGHRVVLVTRGGAHHEALRDAGLRLRTPEGTATLPVPVADRPEAVRLRPGDVLVLAVKTQDSTAALETWAGRPVEGGSTAGQSLPLVCAQNGVANERLALRRFRDVHGMCVWLPSQYLEPGVVTAPCGPMTGVLHLGRCTGGSDATDRRVSADLESSRFLAPVTDDVMRWKYAKLLMNLGNALEAVCGPVGADERAGELLARARAEGVAVLAAAGIGHASDEEQEAARGDRARVRAMPDGAGLGGGSSWQSLARGAGSVEADYLNGEIALLGRLHGVPTPVNETLQRLANAFAREGRAPGSLTASQVAAEVG